MCAKNFQIFGVHIPRRYFERRHLLMPLLIQNWLLIPYPRQKKVTHSPRQHFFENLFSSTTERDGRNYNLFYQNSIRKNEDDLEH